MLQAGGRGGVSQRSKSAEGGEAIRSKGFAADWLTGGYSFHDDVASSRDMDMDMQREGGLDKRTWWCQGLYRVFKAIVQPMKKLGLLNKIEMATGTLRGPPLRGQVRVKKKSAEEGNRL